MRGIAFLLFIFSVSILWQSVQMLIPKYREKAYSEDLKLQQEHPVWYKFGRRATYSHSNFDIVTARLRIGVGIILVATAIVLFVKSN